MSPSDRRRAAVGLSLIAVSVAIMLAYILVPVTQPTEPPIFVRQLNPAAESNPDLQDLSVQPGALVTSPLTVTGSARTWYFEGSFPIKLVDAEGRLLAQVPAQARGSWMTTEFVPFRAMLDFGLPETATGTLILSKDNPSGLPQNDASVRIPVRFQP